MYPHDTHKHTRHTRRTYIPATHSSTHQNEILSFLLLGWMYPDDTRKTHPCHTHTTRHTDTPNTHTSTHQNETCVRILIEKTLPNAKICWYKWHWFWNVWPIPLSYGSSYPISCFRREAVRSMIGVELKGWQCMSLATTTRALLCTTPKFIPGQHQLSGLLRHTHTHTHTHTCAFISSTSDLESHDTSEQAVGALGNTWAHCVNTRVSNHGLCILKPVIFLTCIVSTVADRNKK